MTAYEEINFAYEVANEAVPRTDTTWDSDKRWLDAFYRSMRDMGWESDPNGPCRCRDHNHRPECGWVKRRSL